MAQSYQDENTINQSLTSRISESSEAKHDQKFPNGEVKKPKHDTNRLQRLKRSKHDQRGLSKSKEAKHDTTGHNLRTQS